MGGRCGHARKERGDERRAGIAYMNTKKMRIFLRTPHLVAATVDEDHDWFQERRRDRPLHRSSSNTGRGGGGRGGGGGTDHGRRSGGPHIREQAVLAAIACRGPEHLQAGGAPGLGLQRRFRVGAAVVDLERGGWVGEGTRERSEVSKRQTLQVRVDHA